MARIFTVVLYLIFVPLIHNFAYANVLSDSNTRINDLLNIDYSEWGVFAENLKKCKASQHILPDPYKIGIIKINVELARYQKISLPFSEETIKTIIQDAKLHYKILGWEKNKTRCHIEIAETVASAEVFKKMSFLGSSGASIPPNSIPSFSPKPLVLECSIAKEDIPVICDSAKNAEKITDSLIMDDKVQFIAENSCKIDLHFLTTFLKDANRKSPHQPNIKRDNEALETADNMKALDPVERLKSSNLVQFPEFPKINKVFDSFIITNK